MDVETLGAVEEIKQLKARYFRLLDTKKWDEWADVFTEDVTVWVEDVPDVTFTGRDEFVAAISGTLAGAVTTHHGHMPEIEITGPDAAHGIWAMFDYVQWTEPARTLQGYGHYHEEYRRGADGRWRIISLRLHRLRADLS
ncbi:MULTISPECIES: nuclear transport factor 2 family protein [unclassified Pseudofrankia]|uniref:nuclear transport factor 2 family protein n=1 Tax=unclassified Pseudofrankia TaxID=2994372 RepID=UPI0008DAF3A8|nr:MULTISPECIES: nuclear transport factor 2 family protein [unclassified Pseudofrankia]MDT3445219.1 nuclear transport factor 2 family protein [Pseudofrankia sp. BMG5.37]OHV63309.1 hypothetical protein BCD48_04880 [Pseudofrankia sp. BMG5.36]